MWIICALGYDDEDEFTDSTRKWCLVKREERGGEEVFMRLTSGMEL